LWRIKSALHYLQHWKALEKLGGTPPPGRYRTLFFNAQDKEDDIIFYSIEEEKN